MTGSRLSSLSVKSHRAQWRQTNAKFWAEMVSGIPARGIPSGKPLIYFSLLFLDFFRGVKKVDHSSKITSTQKVHVIKETLTDLKSNLHRQFISRIVDSASLILHIKIGYEFVKF